MSKLPEKKTDWSIVERQLEGESAGLSHVPGTPSLDAPQPSPAHQLLQRFGNPKGLIMQFKAGRIQRSAAVDALKIWHRGQLEVAEVQVVEAVRVHTKKARVEAERFLARIDTEYLEYLGELGLMNVGKRQEMLVRLGDQTSTTLKEVQEADWPEPMRAAVVKQIIDMHDEFAEKLNASFTEGKGS